MEARTNNLFKWFHENHMKVIIDKCHLLVTTNNAVSANIEKFVVNNSNEEKLLGINTDAKLSFENHVSSFWKKATQKLHGLARIVNWVNLSKLKCLMKTFVTSQFNYCSSIWMFHSRELNNRINTSIHQRNLQVLATEIFKLKNGLVSEMMKEVFEIQNPAYNFRL